MSHHVCGKAPNFFLLSHSPHFPPFEAPQIGLGTWLQHDKLPIALFHLLLFQLGFDLGLGDFSIPHSFQCVLTILRRFHLATLVVMLHMCPIQRKPSLEAVFLNLTLI